MSYNVSGYAVDLDRLLGAIGSRDRDLAARVQEHSASWIESYDGDSNGKPGLLGRAIDRLIDGDFENLAGDVRKHDLGYALECLARFLSGREISGSDGLKGIAGQWLYDQPILKELVGGSPQRLAAKMPLPDDFPGIQIIPFEELDARMNAVRGMDNTPDRDLRDAYGDYIWFIETARNRERALITFYS
jgi:hypothetical protein